MVEKEILEDEIQTLRSRQPKMKTAGLVLAIVGGCFLLLSMILLILDVTVFAGTMKTSFNYVIDLLSSLRSGTEIGALPFSRRDLAVFICYFLTFALSNFGVLLVVGGVVLLVLPNTVLKHQINDRRIKLEHLEAK